MSESSSYSSLLALVDSHLSKIKVQSSHQDAHNFDDDTTNNTPSGGFCYGDNKKMAIPSFNTSGNKVNNVLAGQVSNILKAKQSKEEQQQKLSEELKAVHISDDHVTDHNIIDLMDALRTPFNTAVKCDSIHSSTESLFEPEFIEFNDESNCQHLELPVALLKCDTDMTYILSFKEPKGKCSNFGKILVSKFRPFSLPYKRRISFSPVQKFDFKSKSPCDILKEKIAHKNL